MIKKEDDMLANASKVMPNNEGFNNSMDFAWIVLLISGIWGNNKDIENRLSKVEGQIDILKNK